MMAETLHWRKGQGRRAVDTYNAGAQAIGPPGGPLQAMPMACPSCSCLSCAAACSKRLVSSCHVAGGLAGLSQEYTYIRTVYACSGSRTSPYLALLRHEHPPSPEDPVGDPCACADMVPRCGKKL